MIIPVKNAVAIKEAMKKIVGDQRLHEKLKSNARKQITENYEQSVVWNAILAEYKKLEKDV